MVAAVKTGAAPYSDGSGFAVDVEVHEDGDLWLKSGGSTVIMTPAEWAATVEAVSRALQAFDLLRTPTRAEAGAGEKEEG